MWYRTDVNSSFHLCITQNFNTAHPILLPFGFLHRYHMPCYICLPTRGHLSGKESKQAAFEVREGQSKSLKEIYYCYIFFPLKCY